MDVVSFIDIYQSLSIYGPDENKSLAHSKGRCFYTLNMKVKHREAYALLIEELDGISYDIFTYVKGLFYLWSP